MLWRFGTNFVLSQDNTINNGKRNMFSKNTTEHARSKHLQMLRFKKTKNLEVYLGVPLTGRSPERKDFHCLIEQAKN